MYSWEDRVPKPDQNGKCDKEIVYYETHEKHEKWIGGFQEKPFFNR